MKFVFTITSNTWNAFFASLHGRSFAKHAFLHKTIGTKWPKDSLVQDNGFEKLLILSFYHII